MGIETRRIHLFTLYYLLYTIKKYIKFLYNVFFIKISRIIYYWFDICCTWLSRKHKNIMRKIILDCDIGMDDALALQFLLNRKDVEILALTTVSGNATAHQAAVNALK